MKLKNVSLPAVRRMRAHKWLMVSFCAAVAMVLGAMSVGASVFVWSEMQRAPAAAAPVVPSGSEAAPVVHALRPPAPQTPSAPRTNATPPIPELSAPQPGYSAGRKPSVSTNGSEVATEIRSAVSTQVQNTMNGTVSTITTPAVGMVRQAVDNLCLFAKDSGCKPSFSW